MPNSICCNELPINPTSLHGTAESGFVKLENFQGEVLFLRRQGEHTLHIEGTHWKFPMILNFTKQRVMVQIRRNGISFWKDASPELVRGIRNIPKKYLHQLEEAKTLLQMMGAAYTEV